jgi:hypothetical protein
MNCQYSQLFAAVRLASFPMVRLLSAGTSRVLVMLGFYLAAGVCHAQDLAPRAYLITHIHSHAVTLTYSFFDGTLLFEGTVPLSLSLGNTLGWAGVDHPENVALMNFPLFVFALSFVVMLLAAAIGDVLRSKVHSLNDIERDDFGVVLNATLTLLALLIAFSFSMAISRYDQRKNYEEAEANAIGTEYVRADLLQAGDSVKVRDLLRKYLRQRILFYAARDSGHLAQIETETLKLQNDLWTAVQPAATADPNCVTALVIAGMNDVLNSQGYTQAAWWNRIPIAAWGLMTAIAISSNLLIGYGAHGRDWRILLIVPIVVSIAFFLISDLDSPRGGGILVAPQNLISLSESLQPR